MMKKQYENLIEVTRNYLYEKYGAAFLKLNEKQQNAMICETLRRAIKEKISLKNTHGV